MTEGVPIGVKICASAILEADLEVAIQGEVDFISIDGGQAGTKGGPPILEDDFGLPTIYALSRAADYLEKRGVKERVSLLIGGGFFNPGECLKALALGADAVFMGTALIWAMTHSQVTKAVPWEPPTQLVFYPGNMTDEFDEEEAAKYLENFFTSCVEEMKVAIRALGKNSWRQVNKDDLVALDEWTSKVTKVPLAYEPYEPITAGQKCSTKERRKWLSFFQKS
ncbi:isopentenyl pyrophosphate isomerase [compost metagenome]